MVMPYSVLVAEDERAERDSLVALLGREYPEQLRVDFTAANGLFALKYLLSNRVDILFLDIRMPIMDGMEIMREVRKSNQDLEIIVVSAYSDFEYARTAVSYDAADYLLKPYTLESLRQAVSRVLERLARRQRGQQTLKVMEEQRERLRDMLNRDVISTIFFSRSVPSPREFDNLVLLLDLPSDRWNLAVFRFAESLPPPAAGEWDRFLKMYRSGRKNSVVFGAGREMIALDFIAAGEIRSRQELFLEHCRRFCRQELKREVVCSLSTVYRGPEELLSAYRLLLSTSAEGDRPLDITGLGVGFAGETASRLIRGDRDALERGMAELSEKVASFDYLRRAGLLRSYLTLLQGELFRRLPAGAAAKADAVLAGIKEQIIHGDSGELHSCVSGIYRLMEELTLSLGGSREAVTARIKGYVLENIAGDLSVEQLAASEGISASHLSRIFKEVEGGTINRWVVRTRLEKGDEILHGEGCSVKEAAYRVGIRDPNYFTRLYKKEFGKPPTGIR